MPSIGMADSISKGWVPEDIKWNGYLFEAQATATKPAKPRRKRNYDNAACQVEGCDADLRAHKEYHQRYKICEYHLRVPSLLKDGVQQRFCQQCGCFHLLEKFDDSKRSCRAKLQRHNERRRKPAKTKVEPACSSLLATSGSLSGAFTDTTSLTAPYGAPSVQAGSPSGTSIKRTISGSDDSSCQNQFSHKRPRSPIFPPNEFVSSVLPMSTTQRTRPSTCRSPMPLNPFQHPHGLPADVISPFLSPEPSDALHMASSPALNLLAPPHFAASKAPTLSSNESSSSIHCGPHLPMPLATAHSATTLSLQGGHPSGHLPPFEVPSITSPHSMNTPHHHHHSPSAVHDIDLSSLPSLSQNPFPTPASAPHPSLCLDPFTSAPAPQEASQSSWDPLSVLPSAALAPHPPHLTAPHSLPGAPSGPPDMSFLPQDFKDSLSLIPESYAYQKAFDTNTHAAIAMSAPLPDSLFHPVMDSPMLAPPQPTDRSHAWLTPQHILEPPPEYHQWERLTTVSLKLFNCGPSDLPVTLRQDLMLMIDDVQLMEGFIRPGCVLLTVDTFIPASAALPAAAELGSRLTLSHSSIWAAMRFEVRHGASPAARFVDGQAQGCGGAAEAPAPQISAVLPLCISNPGAQRLLLRCRVADAGSMQLFCRANGAYLELRDVSRVTDGAVLRHVGAQEGEVVLAAALPEDCPCTLLKFELVCNGMVSPLAAALVAGSDAVAKEVNELLLPHLGHLSAVLPDVARCLDLAAWLRREYNAARCEVPAQHDSRPSYAPQEVACIVRAARQLLALCCELGWTYTFMALTTIASIGCHDAAQVLAAAAAAGAKQLPLLHLAVRSRKPEMVQLLLDWGIHQGMAWADVGVGPTQITALQLAEALQDGGAIAELIFDALGADDHGRATDLCECDSDAESGSEAEVEDEGDAEAAPAPLAPDLPAAPQGPAPRPAPAVSEPATAGAAAAAAAPEPPASAAAEAGGAGCAAAAKAGGAEEWGVMMGEEPAGALLKGGSSSKAWEAQALGDGAIKPCACGDAESPDVEQEQDLKPRPREQSMVRAVRLMLRTGKQMALLFMVLAFINLTMSLLALFAKDEVEVGDLMLVEPLLAQP